MKTQRLTDKQRRFVEEYLCDHNATQAAIRSGYSRKRADAIGYENLRKPEIAQEIAERMQARSERTEVSADRVVTESSHIAFNDPRKIFNEDGTLKDVKDWPDDVAAAVSSLEVSERIGDDGVRVITKKIRFWDKTSNLNLLARHLGMFTEKVDMRFNHVQALEELERAAEQARIAARQTVIEPG